MSFVSFVDQFFVSFVSFVDQFFVSFVSFVDHPFIPTWSVTVPIISNR